MADSLQASTAGLVLVDRARQRCGWTKTSTARWWQDAHTSRATLRRFWQQERIQREIFIAICAAVGIQDWGAITEHRGDGIADRSPDEIAASPYPALHFDLNEAPDVESFYGRTQEIAQLEQWIGQELCKVASILGMGGIGKTALALSLIEKLTGGESATPFECVIWRSLHTTPNLLTLIDRLLHRLPTKSPGPPQDVEQGTAQLLQYLRQHRCLLVFDGVDALLQRNPDQPRSRETREFWQRLSSDRHQSCILLTSREPVFGVVGYDRIQTLMLKGLPDPDALKLLSTKGLTGQSRELTALIRQYGGNPLALKVMAPIVKEYFDSNLAAYLGQNILFIGDRLHAVLEQQFAKLSPLEHEIIDWLTIWQEPIALSRLQTHLLFPPRLPAILDSVAALEGRSLLEKFFSGDELLLALPPLIRQAAVDDLVERVTQEISLVIRHHDIQFFDRVRTHCLLRPGTDDREGDRILTQLCNDLRRIQPMNLPQLDQILQLLNREPLRAIGYAPHNLRVLLMYFGNAQ